MYRTALEKMRQWKNQEDRYPLLVMGARQVGKTWLMKEFGRICFEDVCYINFETPGNIADIFAGTIKPERIIELLSAYHGKKSTPKQRCLFLMKYKRSPALLHL